MTSQVLRRAPTSLTEDINIKHEKLRYGDGNAFLLNQTGDVTWKYQNHNGIGIAACSRSATMYMVHLLWKLGLNVAHEQQGADGSVGYHLAVIKPDNCLHQVRHPLKQISSNVAHRSWGFADQVMDLPDFGLLSCMRYWLTWNEMCEEFCVWRYQIENLPNIWDEFLERIGKTPCPLPDVPINTNTQDKYGKFKQYTWADLFNEDRQLAEAIQDKAVQYGYDTPEMDKVEYQNLRELETAEVA